MDNLTEYVIWGVKIWCQKDTFVCFGPAWIKALSELIGFFVMWGLAWVLYKFSPVKKGTK